MSRRDLSDWYDYPQYYDLAFRDETRREADFVEAACRKYCSFPVRRLLEPGCGAGRMVVELAARGYDVVGIDRNETALEWVRRRLKRRHLQAEVFRADMADFRIDQSVDAALNTWNTFRHLITERSALNHLRCVARHLRAGGIYILAFHLLPLDVSEHSTERWTARNGRTRVSITLRVVATDRKRRVERLRTSMRVRTGTRNIHVVSEFPFRMYTARQFSRLLSKVPEFELCDVYDFWFEITQPLALNDEITDSVFVLRKRQ